MPNFARLQIAFKNVYVRILTAVMLGVLTGWAIYKADIPQDPSPVVYSQNISEITQLAAEKDRLDYLIVAKPLSDSPRYIYKFKDAPQLHVVKVPSTSHLSLEREVLLKNAIPYSIAKDEYLASHKAVMQDEGEGFGADAVDFLKRHALDLAVLLVILYAMKFGIPYSAQSSAGAQATAEAAARLVDEAKLLEDSGAALLDFTNSGPVAGAAVVNAVKIPVIECHITNIHAREKFRQNSYVSKAARAVIAGFGINGYALAIDGLSNMIGAKAKR